MTIYIDIIFFENLCMNFIILFSIAYVKKIKINYLRLIMSALIGGIYSVCIYMNINTLYTNFFMKLLLSFIMVYVAYNSKNIKQFVKQLVLFYLASFVFGGCAFFLIYFAKPQDVINGTLIGTYPVKIIAFGGLMGIVLIKYSFKFVKGRINKKDMFCDVKISFDEKNIKLKAIIDTGNMLKDPISLKPIVVVQKDMLYGIIQKEILDNLEKIVGGDKENEEIIQINNKYISKFRIIPFTSIGKQNGLLLGFKVDKIIIYFEDENIEIKNIIIGIYNGKLSKNKRYFALLGLDLIEGRKDYESIRNT